MEVKATVENMKTSSEKAQKPRAWGSRLHVLEYRDGNFPWAKYYIAIPPNLHIADLKRTWMFKTKEEAEAFARWFDETLFMLEWYEAAEMLAPYNATPLEAVEEYVKHLKATGVKPLDEV